MILNKFKRKI